MLRRSPNALALSISLQRAAFASFALLCATACHSLSPDEQKIVGTWEFTGLDFTGRVVYRADHVVVDLFAASETGGWAPGSWGRWRLEGNEIVEDTASLDTPDLPRRVTRMPVHLSPEGRLVREDGRPDLIRVSPGAEAYSECLALLYLAGSLIGLVSCIYGFMNSSLRKEFIWLCAAAVCVTAYTLLRLAAESAQTGNLVISWHLLRSLRLPREVLNVGWIILCVIGFTRLVYRLRSSQRATQRI
jgi:hypothetical protein